MRPEIAAAVTNLPLPNYRNYQTLINLVPGATPADFQNAVVDTPARALTTNVNGTACNNNKTLVDGAVNIFIWLPNHTLYVQPVESIENVNITTGSFDAEQGMAGGAAINVATKSGTNAVHGTAFWFHDNQHLRSGAFTKSETYRKPVDAFNQGGGTIGGPLRKDKLFYFFSFERTWERNGAFGNYSVPPADWRQGDFSAWKDYAIVYEPARMTGADARTRTPFPNNVIPKNRISPIFDKIQQQAPLPNQKAPTDPLNLSGTYGAAGSMKLDRYNYDLKITWAANPKLAVWGSYSRMDSPVKDKYIFGGRWEFRGRTRTWVWTCGAFRAPMAAGSTKDDPRYGGLPQLTGFGFDHWGVICGSSAAATASLMTPYPSRVPSAARIPPR